jgi:hypothetical protein
MPAPAWENLDAFLSLDDFAVQALLMFRDGTSITAAVIFDDPFLDTMIGEYSLETTQPRILGKDCDIGRLRKGDRVIIDGREYDVLGGPQEDGAGMSTAPLGKAI